MLNLLSGAKTHHLPENQTQARRLECRLPGGAHQGAACCSNDSPVTSTFDDCDEIATMIAASFRGPVSEAAANGLTLSGIAPDSLTLRADRERELATPSLMGKAKENAALTSTTMATGCSRAASTRGFTLLEVLVALAIAGLALAELFKSELSGLRATQAAARYEQAVAHARSRLALAIRANPLVPGAWRGDDGDGFGWQVHVTPIMTAVVQPAYRPTSRMGANFGVTLYAVTVWITWRDKGKREVRLDTEQIGQAVQ
jgi:prepilin-type N-terminal cleavage/methylation domain-containing protein